MFTAIDCSRPRVMRRPRRLWLSVPSKNTPVYHDLQEYEHANICYWPMDNFALREMRVEARFDVVATRLDMSVREFEMNARSGASRKLNSRASGVVRFSRRDLPHILDRLAHHGSRSNRRWTNASGGRLCRAGCSEYSVRTLVLSLVNRCTHWWASNWIRRKSTRHTPQHCCCRGVN